MSAHTPGPWRWEFNAKHKSVSLCGGKPLFDKTVMDFERFGMRGAAPRFMSPDPDSRYGLLYRCERFAVEVKGREHHADWFKGLDHPDANLIAAAPDLLEALSALVKGLPHFPYEKTPDNVGVRGDCIHISVGMVRAARAAIAKAERRP